MSNLKERLDALQIKAESHAENPALSDVDSQLVKECAAVFLNAAACIDWLKIEFPDKYKDA